MVANIVENIAILTSNLYLLWNALISILIMSILLFLRNSPMQKWFSYQGKIGRLVFFKITLLSTFVAAVPIVLIGFDVITNIYISVGFAIVCAQAAFILQMKAMLKRLYDLQLSKWIFFIWWGLSTINMVFLKSTWVGSISGLFLFYLCLKRSVVFHE